MGAILTTPFTVKVLIADENLFTREGIAALIDKQQQIQVSGQASTYGELSRITSLLQPDIVITESFYDESGANLVCQLAAVHPRVAVLIWDTHISVRELAGIAASGIMAVMDKGCGVPALLETIERVSRGDRFFCSKITARLRALNLQPAEPGTKKIKPYFNEKELHIMSLLCRQDTTAEIAKKVCLSPNTIESIRKVLMQKTGSRNCIGIAIYAIRHLIFRIPVVAWLLYNADSLQDVLDLFSL